MCVCERERERERERRGGGRGGAQPCSEAKLINSQADVRLTLIDTKI